MPATPDAAPTPAGWGALLGRQHGPMALALTGGVALHAVNVHIVTTVLPSVVREIGGLDWYAWNISLFVVASIIGSGLSVRALARLGPRGACLLALALFAAGSIGCATAGSMPWMLAGRSVQGLGGGGLAALSYALIRLVFPPALWPRAVALVSGMWGVATLCGPALGGVFAGQGQWRMAFWSLLPVIALQAVLVVARLGGRRGGRLAAPVDAGVPSAQILLLAASVLAAAGGAMLGGLALQAAGVALGLALGAAALRLDATAPVRLLPRGGAQPLAPLGALYASVALLLLGTTAEIFVPYFLQTLQGQTPLLAGYLTAAMAAGWSLGSMLSSGRPAALAAPLARLGPLLSMLGLLALAGFAALAGGLPAAAQAALWG
ncbi:MFS transporter, partial [Roseomonas sp. 18066]|uniref:MFS transporter n=1 Tax=Roseomonas sp. 18066 TaxID=2681412 RepID=UPI0013595A1A